MSQPRTAVDRSARRACIVGGGIAGLAVGVYLIRSAGFAGNQITIFDQAPVAGGALDGAGTPGAGYRIRGGRMHEEHFACTWDLLSGIPTLDDPGVSVTEEVFAFNARVASHSHARLLRAGRKVDVASYGLAKRDILDLLRLNVTPEAALDGKQIDEWFEAAFFDTVFWHLWATTFAFQRWSSLAEMRRYAIRFMHLLPGFHQLKGIVRTVYNQYDSVVLPIETWLRAQGVDFRLGTPVTDIDIEVCGAEKRATALHYLADGQLQHCALEADDCLFITLGSMVERSSLGSMTAPAALRQKEDTGLWALWERLASRYPFCGRPEVFNGRIDRSQWMSFTATLKTPAFFDHMERFTGNEAGTGGLVTMTDSNWLMSVVLAHQPHFRNQPADRFVFWGDGLLPAQSGNFVGKPMLECGGREILHELFSHLGIVEQMAPLMAEIRCTPCLMPYIDSQFMPRSQGDRPEVIPEGARNFAFLGQFVELPHDCVFTVEYSVRSAQTAVFGLLDCDARVTPLYRGDHNARVLIDALQALLR
ncbi:oleate hydratase [Thauera phenylacetica]|uniref:oleate hydratase n=1 Tax=Thauera phenylacetica TaxID=164400 RepID=UPI0039E46D84